MGNVVRPNFGDLVTTTLFGANYYGLVIDPLTREGCCMVFVGNGLTAEFRHEHLCFVRLGPERDAAAQNFAEVMKRHPVIPMAMHLVGIEDDEDIPPVPPTGWPDGYNLHQDGDADGQASRTVDG